MRPASPRTRGSPQVGPPPSGREALEMGPRSPDSARFRWFVLGEDDSGASTLTPYDETAAALLTVAWRRGDVSVNVFRSVPDGADGAGQPTEVVVSLADMEETGTSRTLRVVRREEVPDVAALRPCVVPVIISPKWKSPFDPRTSPRSPPLPDALSPDSRPLRSLKAVAMGHPLSPRTVTSPTEASATTPGATGGRPPGLPRATSPALRPPPTVSSPTSPTDRAAMGDKGLASRPPRAVSPASSSREKEVPVLTERSAPAPAATSSRPAGPPRAASPAGPPRAASPAGPPRAASPAGPPRAASPALRPQPAASSPTAAVAGDKDKGARPPRAASPASLNGENQPLFQRWNTDSVTTLVAKPTEVAYRATTPKATNRSSPLPKEVALRTGSPSPRVRASYSPAPATTSPRVRHTAPRASTTALSARQPVRSSPREGQAAHTTPRAPSSPMGLRVAQPHRPFSMPSVTPQQLSPKATRRPQPPPLTATIPSELSPEQHLSPSATSKSEETEVTSSISSFDATGLERCLSMGSSTYTGGEIRLEITKEISEVVTDELSPSANLSTILEADTEPEALGALQCEVQRWGAADRHRYEPLLRRLTPAQAEDAVALGLGSGQHLMGFLAALFPPEEAPLARFRRLLPRGRFGVLDAAVQDVLQHPMAAAAAAVRDASGAEALLAAARGYPDQCQRAEWQQRYGYTMWRPFCSETPSRATLLRIFDGGCLRLLKVPHSPAAADHELAVWAALDVRPGDPLVPLLRAVPFTTLAREEVCGFVMPLYCCDGSFLDKNRPRHRWLDNLAHRMLAALRLMHDAGWCHCDVKITNIFLDHTGAAFLGDFGAASPTGTPICEWTPGYAPAGHDLASPLCDAYQLAVTCLVLGGLPEPEASLAPTTIRRLLAADPPTEWKRTLLRAIQEAEGIPPVSPHSTVH